MYNISVKSLPVQNRMNFRECAVLNNPEMVLSREQLIRGYLQISQVTCIIFPKLSESGRGVPNTGKRYSIPPFRLPYRTY
jgi:hypothetical protein